MEILDATTEQGRQGIEEVMERSYRADISCVRPEWALVGFVDGVPVSFITVGIDNHVELPYGRIRYGFVPDAATREDRRREGHFRNMVDAVCERLKTAGIPLIQLHGEFCLYSNLGFGVITNNLGMFTNPRQIERIMGVSEEAESRLSIWEHPQMKPDLLVVNEIGNPGYQQSKTILQAAASLARKRNKNRILFELGSSATPSCPTLDTPFFTLICACGGEIRLQGAYPEGRSVEHADWARVTDAAMFVQDALNRVNEVKPSVPDTSVGVDTETGAVTIQSTSAGVSVSRGVEAGAGVARWPSYALAQLVLGYLPAEALCAIHNTPLSPEAIALLNALFPRTWSFSRDESWVY